LGGVGGWGTVRSSQKGLTDHGVKEGIQKEEKKSAMPSQGHRRGRKCLEVSQQSEEGQGEKGRQCKGTRRIKRSFLTSNNAGVNGKSNARAGSLHCLRKREPNSGFQGGNRATPNYEGIYHHLRVSKIRQKVKAGGW